MTEYGFHPASALFPIMADDELAELAKDIKENGLVEAIVLHEGLVLDGRNRLEACKRAGVNPHFVDWDGGGSPTLYVLSKNLHRRHLTTSQRAVIAAESMPMLQEEAKKRIAQGRPRLGKYPMAESPEVIPEHTFADDPGAARWQKPTGAARDIAAKAAGVGGRIVQHALAVKRTDPKEFERIRRGETTVEEAKRKVVDKEPARSTRLLQVQNKAKRRMEESLSHMRAVAQSLAKLDATAISAQCTTKELRLWTSTAFAVAKSLREFGRKLRRKE